MTGALGLDSSGYSIPYLASWAQGGELETIERTAALIDGLARRIEDAAWTEIVSSSERVYRSMPNSLPAPCVAGALDEDGLL